MRAAAAAAATGCCLRGWGLEAQTTPPIAAASARPDVAAIDRDRILTAAERFLRQPPAPLTTLPCARSPGTARDYYSEAEPPEAASDAAPDAGNGSSSAGKAQADSAAPAAVATMPATATLTAFTAHRDAVFALGLGVPALAAAYLLTKDERYAVHAAAHLRAWFVDSATSMMPRLDYAQVALRPTALKAEPITVKTNADEGSSALGARAVAGRTQGRFEGILETLPLVEIAQAIPFLAASPALTETDRKGLQGWFTAYLAWLVEPQDSGPRLGALARDSKSHHGTSWLLQATAYSLLVAPEGSTPKNEAKPLADLRHFFRTVTLRAQISANGTFPNELVTDLPYRNSLFNLDMVAGICQLLTTRFENVWEYQLEDGPGMRSAIAYHFPFIADRHTWPFRADAAHFTELPGRRVSLLLCARAYRRPEYAALWTDLPPDPARAAILRTMPIHQPLLWVRTAPRVG